MSTSKDNTDQSCVCGIKPWNVIINDFYVPDAT